jgi:ElaB/YqjD/DUF883 family membrane-anchored ribosome-binding protein
MEPTTSSDKRSSKQVDTAFKKEISSIRADLDDLISRLPTLSDIDLAQDKERLIQKIAYIKGTAKDIGVDARQQIDRGIRRSENHIKKDPIKALALVAGLCVLATSAIRGHILDCNEPWCWCDEWVDDDGKKHKARCSHPIYYRCQNPAQDKYCRYDT